MQNDHSKNPTYWQSLEEYRNDPVVAEMKQKEFMAEPNAPEDLEGFQRRDFMKMLGAASAALAGAGCVRRPVQKLVPYVKRPEEMTLGVPLKYATSAVFNGEGHGLVIRTHEGRPVHIEGNPDHPQYVPSFQAQANIMGLYDPERLQGPVRNLHNKQRTNRETVKVNLDELDTKVAHQLKSGYTAILTSSLGSPSSEQTFKDFFSAFDGRVVHWDMVSYDGFRAGQKECYGEASVLPRYRFDRAKYILAVDTDFLGTWVSPSQYSSDFSKGRRDPENMSKMVSFESLYTLTGMNSDERYRIKASQAVDVVGYITYYLLVNQGRSSYASREDVKNRFKSFANVPAELGIDKKILNEVAESLWNNKGQSLVVGGGLATESESALSLNVAVNFLNHILGNDGKTIDSQNSPFVAHKGTYAEMAALIADMNAGKIKTLIIHRCNPVYQLPESAGFKEALKKVDVVIYTGDRVDETGEMADYIFPENHQMESWGDTHTLKGLYSLQQPTIREMYDTRSLEFALGVWAAELEIGPSRLQDPETYHDYVKSIWKDMIMPEAKASDFNKFWVGALKAGMVDTRASERNADHNSRSFNETALSKITRRQSRGAGYELVLYEKSHMRDGGAQANVGWLQELPDPVTKITWDNYLAISLKTAEKEKLKEADMVELTAAGQTVKVRVHIQPGLSDGVLGLSLGYGRWAAGKVGSNIGVNAHPFIQMKGEQAIFSGADAKIKKVESKKYWFANTQGHNSMENRPIAIEASATDYKKKKSAGIHKHHMWSLWDDHEYKEYKWGMTIDLNNCTGCSLCVVACQSENNIPVVGRKYILQGREMHWLRIDRYYSGDPNQPKAVNQPVMCQHCDNAPCESVCPVLATVHDDEGLNTMVYNRCVGTRYCANNCPYKVRRFNWFYYGEQFEKPRNMMLNPNVTVRTRGVMEKCSFCVQRIKEVKNVARNENRKVRDGEVVTACQSSCPTDAIVFGNVLDPESKVSKEYKNDRTYALLEEWNARPAVLYQTKIRNVNYQIAKSHHGPAGGHDKKGGDKHDNKGGH